MMFCFFLKNFFFYFLKQNITSQYRSGTMNDNRQCLEFWYFMYGSHVGILSVEKVSGTFSQVRWTTSGGKGYEWYHAQVNLQSSTSNPTQFDVCFLLSLEKKNFFY
jgi:hypothetical protein